MTHADSIWAKALELHSDSLQSKVDSLQAKLDSLHDKTELFANIVETANDGVNNQLSAANYLLALVAVVIAIAAIWLGIYIGNKKKEIELMAKTIDETKDTVTKIAKDTDSLDKKIHSSLSDLYKDLRKEETNALLDRLLLEPNDVLNLSNSLLARTIETDLFPKLKEAYLKLLKEFGDTLDGGDKEHKLAYLLLFFQHFFYQSIKDDDIAPSLIESFEIVSKTAFKRDILNSTIQLCKALSDENSTFNKEEVLVYYLKALNETKFKNFEDLKNIFEQNITPQTLLQSAINKCTADYVYLQLFGINPPEEAKTTSQEGKK